MEDFAASPLILRSDWLSTSELRNFGTSEEFWMNLQSHYDLRIKRRARRDQIAEITPLKVA